MSRQEDQNPYILSDDRAQQEYIEERRAEKWIPFFLPYLKTGYNVLDCGCGVGSITLDIAERVFPGQVIGVDMDERQLEIGRQKAEERGITNITFEKADVYALPYAKESFDAILAHTLLIHLNDQIRVLKIFHSLLKPSGVVGISDDDWGTSIDSPMSPFSGKNIELMAKVIQYHGGNPFYSRHLRSLLIEAGFDKNEGYALAPEFYGTLTETRRVASVVNDILSSPDFVSLVISKNWATKEELDELIEYNLKWAEAPNSFAAHIYCAAVGWKKSNI